MSPRPPSLTGTRYFRSLPPRARPGRARPRRFASSC